MFDAHLHFFRHCLIIGLLFSVQVAATQTLPTRAPGTPEEQLEAIRMALVEAVSEAPMQVYNTAWIDQKGSLHEATQFHSQAKVRGVRVLAYTAQGQQPPKLRAAVRQEAPPNWTAVKTEASECLQSVGRWRMPVELVIAMDPSLQGRDRQVGAWLGQEAQVWWQQQARQSVRWWWADTQLESSAQVKPVSPYMRAVLGSQATQVQPWRLRLVLRTDDFSLPGWQLHASFSKTDGSAPVWQERLFLPASVPTGQAKSFAGVATLNALREALSHVLTQVDTRGACEPSQFEVRPSGQGWVMPVGAASGFRAGDRVLLMDSSRLPQRLAEPGALGQMAMAEVVQVQRDRAQLKQIAGPTLPGGGHWVALPI